MWIPLALSSAFAQALWMALAKRELQTLSPLRFTLYLRLPVSAALLVMLLWCDVTGVSVKLWAIVLLTAGVECVRMVAFAWGTRRDYYATYSLLNTSPLFVLLLAPHVLDERLSGLVIGGAMCVVVGGFIFYQAGRFQLPGLVAAVCAGAGTTLAKLGLTMSRPLLFTALLFTSSTAMLFALDAVRSGLRDTAGNYRATARRILPLSGLNLTAVLTFMFALNLARATHFAVVFRTSLLFGFVLSLVLLKEYENWPAKLMGACFILAGSVLIALQGG